MLLAALLMPPAAEAARLDPREELAAGADLTFLVEYEGGTTGTREGTTTEEGSQKTLTSRTSTEVKWGGTVRLNRIGAGDQFRGSFQASAQGAATEVSKSTARSPDSYSESETRCALETEQPVRPTVTARMEPDGFHVSLTLDAAAVNVWKEDGCEGPYFIEEGGPRRTGFSTWTFERYLPLVPAFDKHLGPAAIRFVIPYEGRARVHVGASHDVPHPEDHVAQELCAMSNSKEWAPGSCIGSGVFTVTPFIDPCLGIQRIYRDQFAALHGYPPVPAGADESGVRAWAERARGVVTDVLASQRAWMLLCGGDLDPDPWNDMERLMRAQRDALYELAKRDELSQEGLRELLSAERQVQLLGAESDAIDLSALPQFQRAVSAAAPGTLEVRMHSPVSLHVYDEHGGHVGWDEAAGAPVLAIRNATYEGKPGEGQAIVLPAGFYKVVVDELKTGAYVLEVRANASGSNGTEFLQNGKSAPGRRATTHFAVTDGWDGPRLDVFPVRRGDSGAAVSFVDEGRPPLRGVAAGAPSGPKAPAGAPSSDGEPGGKGIPAAGAAVALVALALASRRRRA